MEKKLLVLVVLTLAISFSSFAQKLKYQGELNVGHSFGVGMTENTFDRFTIETVHGVRLNDYFFIGIGAGWHHYSDVLDYFSVIPIYANAKGYFKLGKINPYVSFDIGIGIPMGEDDNGKAGLYISPGIGAGIHVTRWNTLSLLVAYQSQKFPVNSSAISMDAIAVKLAFLRFN